MKIFSAIIIILGAWGVIQAFIKGVEEEAVRKYQIKQWEEDPDSFTEEQIRLLQSEFNSISKTKKERNNE